MLRLVGRVGGGTAGSLPAPYPLGEVGEALAGVARLGLVQRWCRLGSVPPAYPLALGLYAGQGRPIREEAPAPAPSH